MIENELLLLGLLKERPCHGYEIKTRVREILSLFAGVELKSIYYPLRVMEKKGLVEKRSGRQGKWPTRFTYALTKKGQALFDELLTKSFLDFKRPQFSLDLSIYFLRYMKSGSARRRLRGRIFILNRISQGVKEMLETQRRKKTPVALIRILEHNLRLLETEASFLEGLIEVV